MRENIGLYKAKRKDNGDWVEGSFLNSRNPRIIINGEYIKGLFVVDSFEIDSETLCECTGLKDKNGKLIFENDKILVNYGCEQMDISEGTYTHFVKYEKTGWGSQIGFLNGLPCTGCLEVIGNKFEEVRDE